MNLATVVAIIAVSALIGAALGAWLATRWLQRRADRWSRSVYRR